MLSCTISACEKVVLPEGESRYGEMSFWLAKFFSRAFLSAPVHTTPLPSSSSFSVKKPATPLRISMSSLPST